MYFKNKKELHEHLYRESVCLMQKGKHEASLRVNNAAQVALTKPLIN
jgi:hypothetical protein